MAFVEITSYSIKEAKFLTEMIKGRFNDQSGNVISMDVCGNSCPNQVPVMTIRYEVEGGDDE